MQEIVNVIEAVEKSKTRIPDKLRGPSYYSAYDEWQFLRSDHPNMCSECDSYHLEYYNGADLRPLFPYHEIQDENLIYPKVHPNCYCTLVRVYPVDSVESPLELPIESEVKVPLEPNIISQIQVNSTRMNDTYFMSYLDALFYFGLIASNIYDMFVNRQKQKKKEN